MYSHISNDMEHHVYITEIKRLLKQETDIKPESDIFKKNAIFAMCRLDFSRIQSIFQSIQKNQNLL